jgi:hypothetical protein
MNNEPATKQDLQDAVETLIERLATKEYVDAQMATMKEYVDARFDEVTEKLRDVETHLLTEFHRYAQGQQVRLFELERSDKALIERLALIEQRLLELEMRIRPKQ